MRKILIITGHPDKNSYCGALAEAYKEGASSKGNHVVLVSLSELHFNLSLTHGYSKTWNLNPIFNLRRKKSPGPNTLSSCIRCGGVLFLLC